MRAGDILFFNFGKFWTTLVPGTGSDLCLVERLHPTVCCTLVFCYEGGGGAVHIIVQMFFASCVQITC